MDRKDYFKRYYAERKAGIKHGPVKNTSVVDKSTGSRGKEKVMYDPYNFVKVAERLKAEQQKEKRFRVVGRQTGVVLVVVTFADRSQKEV